MRGQRGAILEHLIKNKTITSKEAFEKFGATRLSAIIFDFRKKGIPIRTVDIKEKNRYGETVVFAKYILEKEIELWESK